MNNVDRDIQRKLRALRHAEQIGDISKTCRYFGIGRASFYRWKARKAKKLKRQRSRSFRLGWQIGVQRRCGTIGEIINDALRRGSGQGGRYGLGADAGLRNGDGGPGAAGATLGEGRR